MPVTSRTIRAGDPVTEANGTVVGLVYFNFDDGRQVQKRFAATSISEWNTKIDTVQAKVEQWVAEADAQKDIADEEIAATGEATIKQRAVAYLRNAYSQRDPYIAYRLLDRFNTYRQAKGWSLEQVQANLAAEGLTSEEWDNIRTAYIYLSDAGRVTTMQNYAPILQQWEDR